MKRLLLIGTLLMTVVGCSSMPQTPAERYQNYGAKRLLSMAETNMAKSRFQDANEQFQALRSLHPFSSQAKQAQLDVIYSHYKAGNNEQAIAAADRYIKLYPRSNHVDYAYYMRGLVNFERQISTIQRYMLVDPARLDLTPMDEAFSDYQKLIAYYPDSIYAEDAYWRMVYIRQLMARHELEVARFYLNNGMPVAAVNRASDVIEHYQGTAQVKPALWVMKQSYEQLRFPDLAHDYKDLYDQLKL